MGLWQKWNEAHQEAVKHAPYNGTWNGVSILAGQMSIKLSGFREIVPVAGATAEFDSGATKKNMTATRVLGGAVLFGPAGAIVGGMLKKDRSKVYVVIDIPGRGSVVLDAPAKDEKAAREFAAKVNAAGSHYATV